MRFLFLFAIVSFLSFLHNPAMAACNDPDGVTGDIVYNSTHSVFQGCTKRGWIGFHAVPIDPCPNPGDVCKDSTIYAGLSPDEGQKMYTTTGNVIRSWSNGINNGPDTPMQNCNYPARTNDSCNMGEANTTLLAELSNAVSPYQAATYCDSLVAHGHDDWYLPSINELVVLYTNLAPPATSDWYWSSSEYYTEHAFGVEVGGDVITASKFGEQSVRCVRR